MRPYLAKALLIFLGIVFPVFLLDFSVRLLPVAALPAPLSALVEEMEIGTRQLYREDKELRHTIKRNTDLEFKHPEYTYRLKTNLNFTDAGFRGGTLGGPAWGLALGDSFTLGVGVNQEATWVARLAALAKRDVINLGVSGYGPIQYTRAFEKYGIPLMPKIVFYTLYTNDLDDCVRLERWSSGQQRKLSIKTYLRQNSVTFNLFLTLANLRKRRSRYIEVPSIGVKLIRRKLNDPYDLGKKQYHSAWRLARQQIETAYEYSRRINAAFVLLYFPSKEEVYWDLVKATAQGFTSFEGSRDKLRNDTAEFCASGGFLCLDLSAALRARGSNGEQLYFPIDIHWNETGHRVVGDEIYKFLLDEKIL